MKCEIKKDSTKWCYVGVTNASSDPTTITSVDFTF